jgi:hypothetical protein
VYFAERQIQRNSMAYVVKTSGDPGAVASTVRQIVATLDPQLPAYDLRPLDESLRLPPASFRASCSASPRAMPSATPSPVVAIASAAMTACWLPARRISAITPLEASRTD